MISKDVLTLALVAAAATVIVAAGAGAAGDLVTYPTGYMNGVHYGTVRHGNIREELYTDGATIAAITRGEPAPSGSVITLVDYRDDKLYRTVVMEKRTGWGSEYPPDQRTGEWKFAGSIPINLSKPMKT
jgi:hypothetical protein